MYLVGSSTPVELLCVLACQDGGTSLGRLRTRCRWEPVGGVGKGCRLCAKMKQALYPSLRRPGRGPAHDPTPGTSTRGRSATASVTSKYTMWYRACGAIGCCMCHRPYRAAAHGLASGDATRRGTTHHFGPVRRSGASIRHGGVLSGNCKTLSQDPGGSMELFGLRADYRLRLRTQRRRRRHTIDSGAIFSGADFRGVVFAGAVFRGADLSRAALTGAVFGSAVFSSGVFACANDGRPGELSSGARRGV